ncbi:polysaccharide deacetylase family protein [Ornithinibacillus californiensis]|uniref:polysaccharide deacetylase family protein n=1 Tax=Ornithinibacillus californiensis TaxID=161536 RepID=UPI00069CC57B|nr:polysaccharide deacetylase family protein [Ornithinibacillus californiensis]
MYQLRLLQLLDIQEYEHDFYLHLNIQLEEQEEFYWKVDPETAQNLQAITDFSKGYLYRLSLRMHQNKWSLTQTHRDQSLRKEFTCSDAFCQELLALKQVNTFEELDQLPFISRHLVSPSVEAIEVEVEKDIEKQEEIHISRSRRFTWPLATALITVIAIICTYTGHSIYTNAQAQPEGASTNHAVKVEKQEPVKENLAAKPETNLLEENIRIEDIPEIPFFELEDGMTHGIPEGMVALTFDDGPSQYSAEIVDILKDYGVGGTFFLVGINLNKYPEQVAYINDSGYSIGTHSMSHINFATSPVATQKNEIYQSSRLIEDLIGEKVTLFRPPYGQFNDNTKQISTELAHKMVLWNNDPKDWESRNTDKIIQHIKSTEASGSIILLHETKATVDALPEIISYLQGLDLQLVSLQ